MVNGEVVVSFRVSKSLKRELYRAVGEVQARHGEKLELKKVGSMAIALVIAYLRGQLPSNCTAPAEEILSVEA